MLPAASGSVPNMRVNITATGIILRASRPKKPPPAPRMKREMPQAFSSRNIMAGAAPVMVRAAGMRCVPSMSSGTFPIQSERFYNPLKGHGATVRYVQLPFESHGYAARENLLHMLWEQHQWLEKYVKNAGK